MAAALLVHNRQEVGARHHIAVEGWFCGELVASGRAELSAVS